MPAQAQTLRSPGSFYFCTLGGFGQMVPVTLCGETTKRIREYTEENDGAQLM